MMRRNFFLYGISEATSKGLNVLLILVLPLLIPIGEYAKVIIYVAYEQIIYSLIIFGQSSTFIKFYSKLGCDSAESVVRATNRIISFTTFFSCFIISGLYLTSIIDSQLVLILTVITFCNFFISRNEIQNIAFRVDERHNRYFLSKNIFYVLKFILCISFVVFIQPSAVMYVYAVFISSVFVHFAFNSDKYFLQTIALDKIKSAKYFYFALPVALQSIINILYSFLDRFMIDFFLTKEDLAVYGFSYNVGSLGFFFISLLTIVLLPRFYKEGEINNLSITILNKFLMYSCFFIFCYMFFIYGIFEILTGYYDSRYAKGVVLSLLVCFSYVFHVLYLYSFYKLNLSGKMRFIPCVSLLSLAFNASANYILIPLFGINGAGYSLVLSQILFSFLTYIVVRVEIKNVS